MSNHTLTLPVQVEALEMARDIATRCGAERLKRGVLDILGPPAAWVPPATVELLPVHNVAQRHRAACDACGGPLEGWAGERHSQQCSLARR